MELLNNCPICGSPSFELFLSGKDYFLTEEDFNIVKCKDCGFRYTNPRPEITNLGRYYQSTDYISHSDSSKGLLAVVYQIVRKYTLRRKMVMIQKFKSTGEILDIGCATGQFLKFMADNGWIVTGIEPDKKTRLRAISSFGLKIYPEEQINLFKNSTFDVITMWHVLEHVSDLKERMQQLGNLLKPDGTLIIAVPNSNSYDAQKYEKFWAGYDLPRHLYHFTKVDMKLLFDKFGFTIVKTIPMKFDSYYVSLLSEKYKSGKMRWAHALWNGFWSNMNSGGGNGHSSIIYIIKKK
jgi:SAM-dependent methyltransferase